MKRKMSKDEIKKIIEEENVEYIRLQFVDIFGTMKNVAITLQELDRALNNEFMFDGSAIEGFVRIEESDMRLHPDLSTFKIIPWYKEHKIARFMCDVYMPNGDPFVGDPRYRLRLAIAEAKKMGYDFFVGPECEFFLFHTNEDGSPSVKTHDDASYFDLAPSDLGENARIDMVHTLQQMDFYVEAAHHEGAPGQHEIDFKYTDAMNAADNITTLRITVKVIAKEHGLHATFMPKPVYGVAGSGMHCNMSLFKGDTNVFYDENDKYALSKEAYYFLGGLIEHAKGMTLVTNPLINSYKRLVSGYEAPVHIAWSSSNRSPLIRVPSSRGLSTRLELRNPDPSCNPYLAFAVMLKAGLDGIKNKIEPPTMLDQNAYIMSKRERLDSGIDRLPESLGEAILEMEKDEVVKEALGEHVFTNYVKAKKIEWKEYQKVVHPWEVEKFITKF